MNRHRIDVPPDRMVVEYEVDPEKTMEVWNHAAGLRAEGWRMLSVHSHVPTFMAGWFRDADRPAYLWFTILYEMVESTPDA